MSEGVDHPEHYGGGDNPYETIKVLEKWLSPEEFIGFCRGNTLKYLSRAFKKGTFQDGLKDLEKAKWYLQYEVDYRKRQAS